LSRFPSGAIRLLNGFRGYQLVVAACRLGLPDLVAAASAESAELAVRTRTDADAMRRERVTDGDVELSTVMSDLHMMVLLGGRERTTSEYAFLLESAGLRLSGTVAMPSEFYIVEALTA
jgi:hypothetical protein